MANKGSKKTERSNKVKKSSGSMGNAARKSRSKSFKTAMVSLGKQLKEEIKMKVDAATGGKKRRLDEVRAYLQPMVNRANEAISRLTEKGLLEDSEAYQRASQTHSRAKSVNQDTMFNVEDKKSYRELVREANRLYEFLGSADVKENVAAYNQKIHKDYGFSFREQRATFERTGNRFDAEDQDRMKLALRIFRDIASTETSVIGKDIYDSDSLLNLIYDELEGYDPENPESDESFELQKQAHDAAYWAVENFKQNVMWGFVNGTPMSQSDVGIIERMNQSQNVGEFLDSKDLNRRNF